jgi:hypothetical protein
LVPARPDRHYLWVSRISGFVITMLGLFWGKLEHSALIGHPSWQRSCCVENR